MTKPDLIAQEDKPLGLTDIVRTIFATLLIAFALGVCFGMGSAIADHGVRSPAKLALAITAVVAMLVTGGVMLRRTLTTLRREPVAPNVRKARWLVAGMILAGIATSAILSRGAPDGLDPLFEGGAVPVNTAIAFILMWALLMPLFSLLWWRQIDELERFAYRDGGFWAVNFYALATPIWWVGWRAGLFVEPQHMTIFAATMIVWSIAWLYRRYN